MVLQTTFSTLPLVLIYSQHTSGSQLETRVQKCSLKYPVRDSADLQFQNDCMGCLYCDLLAHRESIVQKCLFAMNHLEKIM